MLLIYFLALTILTAWLIHAIFENKLLIRRTPLDLPLWLFLISQILATFFSVDHHLSLFGYYGRFNEGLFALISYVILYYAFISHFSGKAAVKIKSLLYAALTSGFFVSLYALLQKLGIDKNIWVQDVQARPFATFGQPNWLAAFLLILLPISFGYFLLAKKTWQRWLLAFLTCLYYLVLLLTRSRSGLLAFWSINLSFWFLFFGKTLWLRLSKKPSLLKKFHLWLQEKSPKSSFRFNLKGALVLNLIFFLLMISTQIVPYAKTVLPPAEEKPTVASASAELNITDSGEIRTIVWQGAIAGFKARPLFGWGKETFAWVYYQFKPLEQNLTSEWDFLYNKAHNEYLNYLATTGIIGFTAYLFLIGSVVFIFLIRIKPLTPLNLAFFAAWFSLLITNFFGFSVVVTSFYFYLLPALIFSLQPEFFSGKKPSLLQLHFAGFSQRPKSKNTSRYLYFLGVLVVIFFLFTGLTLLRIWLADYYYFQAKKLNSNQDYSKAYDNIIKTINFFPREPVYYDELALISANLAYYFDVDNQSGIGSQFATQAIAASDAACQSSPLNVVFLKTRTRLFYTLSQLPSLNQEQQENYLNQALDSITKAAQLSPHDAKIAYNLALIYEISGQTEKALETLKKTLEMKPDYQDARETLELFQQK